MNQTIVIYESKYGFTERYANWIAKTLSCPMIEKKNFHAKDFANYDTIIYGGGLYAGGISGIKLLTQNFPQIRSKNIILFTCGLANPDDPANVSHIRESLKKVLTPEILDIFHIFHLRGGIDYSRLNLVHRSMMAMLARMLSKKSPEDLREEDQLLLETYGKTIDFTNQDTIQPLIDYALGTGQIEKGTR